MFIQPINMKEHVSSGTGPVLGAGAAGVTDGACVPKELRIK